MEWEAQDWIMVQVDEAARAARRVAVALLGVGDDEEEVIEVESASEGLLDDALEDAAINRVDARTAARMLRPASRVRGYAQLLADKSRLLHERGLAADSHQLARRALELHLEAAALEARPELIDFVAIDTLLARSPALVLGRRYRDLLAELDGEAP